VKTSGGNNQVRITSDYKIGEESTTVDREIEDLLYKGLKPYLGSDVTMEKFISVNRISFDKVQPTISSDLKRQAIYAIFFALLIIALYITVRFRNWAFGLGGLVSLFHDSVITIGAFSLLDGWLPFSLSVDQSFIAAILTVVGYSIMDTVVVFDRIREHVRLHPKQEVIVTYNNAMNSTLRRTFSTSLTVLIVLLAIFLFGGTTIKGFIFALLFGIFIGTYSSVFVATPVAYDTMIRGKKKETGNL
jgi:SecD/SecF fusion protein